MLGGPCPRAHGRLAAIVYARAWAPAVPGIYWIAVDGSAPEELLVKGRFRDLGFARDGRLFAARIDSTATGQRAPVALWSPDPAGDRTPKPVISGSAKLVWAMASPDDRRIIVVSNWLSEVKAKLQRQ